MAAKIIHIDSYIGRWGYGKELLRFDLDGTQKEGAVIRISSLGGDVFHALDMYNQIAAHGNVEVIFAGPSASAATFLAMSARKVSIVDNCFLLVHKVMAGVENYGHFNEDELDALIADLKTLKKENREFDRAIAHIYSKRTGKSHQEIISQMKANTWISAAQALEFGFVDQVIEPDQKVNYHSERFVAMVSASELPPFPQVGAQTIQPIDQTCSTETCENQKSESMIHCKTLNSVLEVDALESTFEGTYLNQEQLQLLDSRLEAALQAEHNYEEAILERDNARSETDSLKAQVTELTTARDSAISERDTAIENQRTAEESTRQATASQEALTVSLDAIDPTVASADSMEAKVEAIRQLLSRLPGAGVPGILDRKDKPAQTDGVDWTLINSLPHNQSVDKNQ